MIWVIVQTKFKKKTTRIDVRKMIQYVIKHESVFAAENCFESFCNIEHSENIKRFYNIEHSENIKRI